MTHSRTLFTTWLLLLAWLLCSTLTGQIIVGKITNEFNEPLPFSNVFVKQLATGTVSDDEGSYTLVLENDGEYDLVFSSLGYESKSIPIAFTSDTLRLNVQLFTSGVDLEEITVSASKKDPAFGIIRKVIEHKKAHLRAAKSYRTKVYVKATEEIDRKKKRVKEAAPEPSSPGQPGIDPFEAQQQANQELLGRLNMVEMEVQLNYQYPNRYKEERTAYKTYGDGRGLFVPRFAETDFNFYRNMVQLTGISDAPIISPISNNAILTYKYKLLSTDYEDGELVYKIEVIPRKKGNSTVQGLIYINEGSWTINRLDFAVPSAALKFFDEFSLQQAYTELGDSLWIVGQQSFNYLSRQGKKQTFKGTTTLAYSDYEHNFTFPAKFFGNEVAVTTQEAYERDTAYWADTRAIELTTEEARMVAIRDSIEAVVNSEAYQDSITRLYNKITLADLAFDGVGFRNNKKKTHLYFGPLPDMIGFSVVGGWRVGPYISHFKRFPNGKILSNSGTVTVGLRNRDIQGNFSSWFRYDPFRLGDISISGGRSFESINQYDAYLNQLRPSNYILRDAIRLGHRIELFNGFYISSSNELNNRQSIAGYNTGSFLNDVVEDDEEILDFEGYQAFITTNAIFYTPGQRYMREPNRKVVLGSKWPTFSILHRKGWNRVLGSDIDFDYLEFAIEQDIPFGALGNSKYRAQLGQFVNTKDLRFVDIKRFRQSDDYLYSHPLHSFQALDTSLTTRNLHFEFHHIHHFNGAIMNNIPLLKETKVRAVAGGGFLWMKDGNYRHQEVFVGMERTFKIGARRRLRLGVYGVLADATDTRPTTAWKISFDLIDLWKRDWSF